MMKFIEESSFQTQEASNTQISSQNGETMIARPSKSKKISDGNSKICNRWATQENLLYVRFLKQNNERFTKQSKKKFCKFEKMSFYIESKSADQCRSHHQKMMIRFKSIDNIIAGLLSKQIAPSPVNKMEQEFFKCETNSQKTVEIESFQIQQIKSLDQLSFPEPFRCLLDQDVFSVLF